MVPRESLVFSFEEASFLFAEKFIFCRSKPPGETHGLLLKNWIKNENEDIQKEEDIKWTRRNFI